MPSLRHFSRRGPPWMTSWPRPVPDASTPKVESGVVLALDIGDVRIGVAMSDRERRLAVPLTTLLAGESWIGQVGELVTDHEAVLVV